MKQFKPLFFPLLLIAAAVFALPPLFLQGDMGGAVVLLFGVLPAICFICGLRLGKKQGIVWSFAPFVAVLFFASIPLYYNSSAAIYGVVNAGVALAGNCLGAGLPKQVSEEAETLQDGASSADN